MIQNTLLQSYLSFSGMDQRHLQELPDYTSPPLPIALEATPEFFRSDEVINTIRQIAADGNCTVDVDRCHIPFPVAADAFAESKVGVVLYGGALVDPRGYSPVAQIVAERYGLPVVMPIFNSDLAFSFGTCDTGRLDMAKAEFPQVEKWVLAGHSFGGVGATTDLWERFNAGDETAAGLVLLAADVQQGLGCGETDFSNTSIPTASLAASLDGVLNFTRFEANKVRLSPDTFFMDMYGANHASFGAYDSSERESFLGQTDGVALFPSSVSWDLVASAIAQVASRTGLALPQKMAKTNTGDEPCTAVDEELDSSEAGVAAYRFLWASFAVAAALVIG